MLIDPGVAEDEVNGRVRGEGGRVAVRRYGRSIKIVSRDGVGRCGETAVAESLDGEEDLTGRREEEGEVGGGGPAGGCGGGQADYGSAEGRGHFAFQMERLRIDQ